jgi:hypothetical protein
MIIYVNGCSNSDDLNECKKQTFNNSFLWHHYLMKKYSDEFRYFKILKNKFQSREWDLRSNVYNIEDIDDTLLINDAVSGSSNDWIFHKSLESLSLLINSNKRPDLVVVQWSGPNRRQLDGDDNNPLKFVNPYDNTEFGIKLEPMGSLHTLHYIFSLQEFLIKNNINYIFFNYIGLDESVKKTQIISLLDTNHVLEFGNNTLFNGLVDLIKEKKFNRDKQGHPNQEGAKFIAEKIFEKTLFLV